MIGIITDYMKKETDLAGYKATVSRLRTLLMRERIVSGTLNVQKVGNAKRYTLTDKVNGKTRCLYVPVSMEAKVRKYVENWKELKVLMQEMSEMTRQLLAAEIAETTGRKSGKNARAGKLADRQKTIEDSAKRKPRNVP